MSSFKSRARKLAFGDSSRESLSDCSSEHSNHSRTSLGSLGKLGVFRQRSSTSELCNCCSAAEKTYATPRRTNRVRRLNRNLPFERFVEAIEEDGCVVVEDFINPQISQRVASAEEIDPDVAEQRLSRTNTVDVNEFIRESLAVDSLYQLLTKHFLSLESVSYHGKRPQHLSASPRLSKSSTIDLKNSIDPISEKAIANFRREDCIYHQRHAAVNKYDYQSRRDVSLGLFVPELDSLSAAIAVKTIPGSHLWDDQKPDISKGVKDIELHGGDALILLGSIYYQASVHGREEVSSGLGTPKDKLMHEIWVCNGVLRCADELTCNDLE